MAAADAALVIAEARRWVGTPYHHQASRIGAGCDCLGLVRGIWRGVTGPEIIIVPAYSRDWGEAGGREVLIAALRTVMIEIAAPAPGALTMFRMSFCNVAKHTAVMTNENTIIHATERSGVIEEPLTAAWRRLAVASFQFPSGEV